MKARVKATGEIGIVANIAVLFGNKGYRYQSDEVEIIDSYADIETAKEPDYWDKLLHQYAGMAMQGILSNNELYREICKSRNLEITIMEYAHALVEKMKEERK